MKIKKFLSENLVVIFFALLCVISYLIAKQNPYMVVKDLINRVMRNSIMVLALIIPILAGMGLNFGIVVGAMSAQAAIIFVTHWRLSGIGAIVISLLIATVVSIICGFLLGKLFNSTRGQEMISGMIAGYFGQGIYLLIFLVLLGTVIPFYDAEISITTGIGIKDTLTMNPGYSAALDNVFKLPLSIVLWTVYLIYILLTVLSFMHAKKSGRHYEIKSAITRCLSAGVVIILVNVIPVTNMIVNKCMIPIVTLIFIIVVSVFVQYITKTKLGQDFRSVGADIHIAEASGIDVNKVRIYATIFSTVLASWGQFVFLQNLGTFSTYTAQTNVGTYSIAALLVGGASIDRANVKQAFTGVVLFQLLFLLAPATGTNLFNDTQVGEYFRTIISNGVIAVALVLHAVNKIRSISKAASQE